MAAAAKKAGRATGEGLVASYIHTGGKIGVLVEVNCETDFVARSDDFQELVHDLAMHVAAAAPRFLRREEVTEEVLAGRARDRPRPGAQGRASPRRSSRRSSRARSRSSTRRTCLLEQPFVKDPDKTVGQLVTDAVAKIGENIQVRRFARFVLGES